MKYTLTFNGEEIHTSDDPEEFKTTWDLLVQTKGSELQELAVINNEATDEKDKYFLRLQYHHNANTKT